ncbi:cation diffusion facilitator transporter [Rhodococcoides trifolii]|uniref:Cation diffusion facilitator transporter n=1 Tax=Rhodococcoides trifolii TaxID=908250 RepID=A0A917CNG1_9NOCA|nr:cation diffusion facilitator family transporter [Rhodococcus trifolii]GGF93476.1 cation diffusion facilitator transporter [Rhodococcus trifolii]
MAEEKTDESTLTVVLAFGANALVAVAKTGAALFTGSASMVAEAAHSWADTGNEVLLLIANKRSRREPDDVHPFGYGREAYVWSMFAALGLFALGAGVSITHGVQELSNAEPAGDFLVAYIVLAVAFVLEAISFRQAYKQLRGEAKRAHRDVMEQALATSDPTVRAVFAEDAAALVGLVIAFVGILLHQITGSPIPDAIGSILVGILLAVVAVILIDRNRRFLLGEAASPQLREGATATLTEFVEVQSVSFLRMEYVGPRRVYLIAGIDLVGDYAESRVAETLHSLERRLEENQYVVRAMLTLG